MTTFQNTMESYGYTLVDTGGGCTAYSNGELLITDGNAQAPERLSDPVTLTWWDSENSKYLEVDELIKFLHSPKSYIDQIL